MDMVMGVAMLVGIAPALALMFLGTRDYTYPRVERPFFSDASFFMLFVAGMIEGSIVFFVLRIFNAPTSIILMVLIAVVQTMLMVVSMNLKRYRGKSDSVFYGFALGLGNACGLSAGFCYLIYGSLDDSGVGVDASFVSLIIIAISMALILGSCGAVVGEGIARHRVMEFGLQALLPMVAYYMLLSAAVMHGDGALFYAFLFLMLVLSGLHYYYVMYRKLPQIVREVLRQEGRRRSDVPKRRRRAR